MKIYLFKINVDIPMSYNDIIYVYYISPGNELIYAHPSLAY